MPYNRENVQLQVYCRAPAPSRDYCGLTVNLDEVSTHFFLKDVSDKIHFVIRNAYK